MTSAWWRLQGRLHRRLLPGYVARYGFTADAELPIERHGDGACGYVVSPECLSDRSVVYSFGVGADVSFELSLIETHGLEVHAFDPTPESAAFVAGRELPTSFHFHPWALAARDGPVDFHTLAGSSGPGYRAGTVLDIGRRCTAPVEGRSLAGAMAELGHSHLHLLKLDVEGAEYPLIESMGEAPLPVCQLVFEFHPHLANLEGHSLMAGRRGWERTAEAVAALRRHGFELFHVSERGTELSFRRAVPGNASGPGPRPPGARPGS